MELQFEIPPLDAAQKLHTALLSSARKTQYSLVLQYHPIRQSRQPAHEKAKKKAIKTHVAIGIM